MHYTLLFSTGFQDFVALIPELYLVSATIILLVYGVALSTSRRYSYPVVVGSISWLAILSLGCTFLLLWNNPLKSAVVFSNILVIDPLFTFLKELVILSTAAVILMSLDYFKQQRVHAFEYIILMLFATCSMLFMLSSFDFISMYLAIEFQSLCFYVLAASRRTSEFSTEAGVKYFVLGAFSSGILLYGCSVIYGSTGMTNFFDLAMYTDTTWDLLRGHGYLPYPKAFLSVLLGMMFLAVGILFKLTAAPFHMWAPDVYEGSPTPITAFFALVPKIALMGLAINLFIGSCGPMFSLSLDPWRYLMQSCIFLSMTVGSFGALVQTKIKRMLAYSSIGHVGFLLFAFFCADHADVEALQVLLIYLVMYTVMTIGMFAVVLSLHHRTQSIKYIDDLSMIGKTNPMLGLVMAVILFSMAGIPPLGGFFAKYPLFLVGLQKGWYWLVVTGVLTSAVSCFYYIRLVKIMFFEQRKGWMYSQAVSKETSILVALVFFFLCFFCLFPEPLFVMTEQLIAHSVFRVR